MIHKFRLLHAMVIQYRNSLHFGTTLVGQHFKSPRVISYLFEEPTKEYIICSCIINRYICNMCVSLPFGSFCVTLRILH